jgi:hypothetical protein
MIDIAPAIRTPSLYAVSTAPRSVLKDPYLFFRGKIFQKTGIIGKFHLPLLLQMIKKPGKRHVPELEMMPV